MGKHERVYVKLQQHLNRQAVGFPATRSGAEIKILKHIFTPDEAQIAVHLSYKLEPLETVFSRVEHLVETREALSQALDRLQRKGGIESRIKHAERHYGIAPLVVGMYEMQLERLTPEFIRDFDEYISDKKFAIEFLSTRLPQMRTIPVSRSIRLQPEVATFDEVAALLRQADPPFVILECICRKKKSLQGKSCRVTDRSETCLGIGSTAEMILAYGSGRQIDRDEAAAVIVENQKQGLVLQPSNTQKVDFICSCCGCCCGMLGFYKSLPKPLEFWSSNFHAAVDMNACDGCGACGQRCQVGAVQAPVKKQPAVVDLNLCIGCGLCVTVCPTNALSLLKRPIEVQPPETREELYDIIKAGKQSRLGKLRLTTKLVIDTIRTGRFQRLK